MLSQEVVGLSVAETTRDKGDWMEFYCGEEKVFDVLEGSEQRSRGEELVVFYVLCCRCRE